MASEPHSPLKLIYAVDDESSDETEALLRTDSECEHAPPPPSAATVLRDAQHLAKLMPGAALMHSSAFDPPTSHSDHREADLDLARQGSQYGKRRWLGVILIISLNVSASFGAIAFAPIASLTRDHFGYDSLTAINWLTLSGGFMYFLASPWSILVTRYGAKQALLAGSASLIIGSWLRFAGIQSQSYALVLVGSLFVSASQPFALNLPVHYSDLWFDSAERVEMTGLMTLANPLGQALASLIVPLMVARSADLAWTMLIIAIVSTVICSASIFMPVRAKVHLIHDLSEATVNAKRSLMQDCSHLFTNKAFLCLLVQFSILVAAFNALATLTEQITHAIGYSGVQAGLLTAAMVIVGLITSAIGSPILDKSRAFKKPVLFCVGLATLSYFALAGLLTLPFSFMHYGLAFVLFSLIGACALLILPLALELAADVNHPLDPELPATVMWMLGQLFGACLIVSMDALKNISNSGTYTGALVLLTGLLCFPLPAAILLVRSGQVEKGRALRNGEDG